MTTPNFSYTAFAREDQDDAARRAPAYSLEQWAQARSLDYRGQELPGAFVSVLTQWPDHLMNVSKGVLASRRFGFVAHQLYELITWDGSIRAGGQFWGSRVVSKQSAKAMIGLGPDAEKGPFDGLRAFAPTTAVCVRVPEAAFCPTFVIRNSDRLTIGSPGLGKYGLNGLSMAGTKMIDDELRAQIASALVPAIGGISMPFFELKYSHGALKLSVNGYQSDPAMLDYLVDRAVAAADALAALSVTRWPDPPRKPFADPWPAPGSVTRPLGYPVPSFEWDDRWKDQYTDAAAAFGMQREDPVAYHEFFRAGPIPGLADGVLAGQVTGPHGNVPLRLVWAVQGGFTAGTVRGAAVFPLPQPAAVGQGPVGGILDSHSDMYLEVADDFVFVWNRRRSVGVLDAQMLHANASMWVTRLSA